MIAKVDGPGQFDLRRILKNSGPPSFIYFDIFLHIFIIFSSKIDRVMDGERLRRPLLMNYQF